jgi:GNAT superfamily N-acetyltransferase
MPYLPEHLISTIDRYWASFLHCSPDVLKFNGTLILTRPSSVAWRGVYFFHRQHTLLVSIPPDEYELLSFLEQLTITDLNYASYLRGLVGGGRDQVVGPAFVGYTTADIFQSIPGVSMAGVSSATVQQLDASHRAALDDLRVVCGELAWECGGSWLGLQPVVGAFVHQELVALASYTLWNSSIAHLSVITHPRYRGRGYGKAVVHAITITAIERGLIPQYRTLFSNQAAMALGRALGFQEYATTVVVQYSE